MDKNTGTITQRHHLTKAHGPSIRARDDGCKWQKLLAQNGTEGSTTLNRSELITVQKNNKINIKVPDTMPDIVYHSFGRESFSQPSSRLLLMSAYRPVVRYLLPSADYGRLIS